MSSDREGLVDRAIHLLELRRPAEALEVISRQLASSPHDGKALLAASVASRQVGQFGAAVDFARRALAVIPHMDAPYAALAAALMASSRPEEAVDAAYRAVQMDPQNWINHVRYSECLLALPHGRDRAWEAAQYAVRLAPQEAAVHLQIAAVASQGGRSKHNLDIAERALAEAARLSPTDPRLHYEMAQVRFVGSRDAEALDSVANALASDPTGFGVDGLAIARRLVLRVVFAHACLSIMGAFAAGAMLGPRPAIGNRIALGALTLAAAVGMLLHWRRVLVGPEQRRLAGMILRESRRVRASLVFVGLTLAAWLAGALWPGTTGKGMLGASLLTAVIADLLVWGPFFRTIPANQKR